MPPRVPMYTLNNCHKIPCLALGTWKADPQRVGEAVKTAVLKYGYNHIDCAHIYGNEKPIGQAFAELFNCCGVKREDLFITSKLWCTFHRPDRVEEAVRISIEDLQCKYLDLYLIHWPQAYKEGESLFPKDANGKLIYSDVDYVHTWLAMEKICRKGLTKSIGISNFNSCQINRTLQCAQILPACIQMECHPFLNNFKLIDYCRANTILVEAYSPLGSGLKSLLTNPILEQIARKYNKSVPQVLLRYPIDRGLAVLSKTTREDRLCQNMDIFDFQLSSDEMNLIASLERNGRTCVMDDFDHKDNPFHLEY